MAVFVILTVLALNTWTSEGVRLPNYIPTLQVNPGGRNDSYRKLFSSRNSAKKSTRKSPKNSTKMST